MDKTGMALMLEPGPDFGKAKDDLHVRKKDLFSFIHYLLPFKSLGVQLVFGLAAGSIIQLILPFLSQAMVDKGINGKNMGLITLILIAQLFLFMAQLLVSYIRSWIMLHINARIDINLISDFLIKLMNMPLHFFDTKRTGDILQRIGDHGRIKSFLLGNSMNIIFHSSTLLYSREFWATTTIQYSESLWLATRFTLFGYFSSCAIDAN